MKLRCHYEVLTLERDAAATDVKKAFHKQALKWHPDKHQKNNISSDEATQRFQEIQNAYEVLSDPHERKWYDEHRDQILRGDDDGDGENGENKNELNLFKFFSASVYSGFGDDEKSFYSVYGALFEKIDLLDLEVSPSQPAAPSLGNASTSIDSVNEFYRHWGSYITQRHFAWVDEYKTTDAPTRQIRRAMEKENKKLRDAEKKQFTNDVRELVEFVKKRDPRMLEYLQKKEKEKKQQVLLDEQKKKDKQAKYEAERAAFQQEERTRWSDDALQTSRLADDQIQEELEKLRQKMDAELLVCEICNNKSFKSDKQLQNHFTSKKHKEREVELGIVSGFDLVEDELEKELQAELAELKRAKQAEQRQQASEEEAVEKEEHQEDGQEEDDEAALEAAREKERVRLEKDQKAAEKRKERKDARKTKKKEGGTEPAPAAVKKQEQEIDEFASDDDDGTGGKGKRGKGSRGKKKSR